MLHKSKESDEYVRVEKIKRQIVIVFFRYEIQFE